MDYNTIIALYNAGQLYCRNAPRGAFCSTFDHLSFRHLFCQVLSGRFTQVLLYLVLY